MDIQEINEENNSLLDQYEERLEELEQLKDQLIQERLNNPSRKGQATVEDGATRSVPGGPSSLEDESTNPT
jgi:hypothetical protein